MNPPPEARPRRWAYRRALVKATEEHESRLLAVTSNITAEPVFGAAPVPSRIGPL